jgi:hypothetical protein
MGKTSNATKSAINPIKYKMAKDVGAFGSKAPLKAQNPLGDDSFWYTLARKFQIMLLQLCRVLSNPSIMPSLLCAVFLNSLRTAWW